MRFACVFLLRNQSGSTCPVKWIVWPRFHIRRDYCFLDLIRANWYHNCWFRSPRNGEHERQRHCERNSCERLKGPRFTSCDKVEARVILIVSVEVFIQEKSWRKFKARVLFAELSAKSTKFCNLLSCTTESRYKSFYEIFYSNSFGIICIKKFPVSSIFVNFGTVPNAGAKMEMSNGLVSPFHSRAWEL